MQIYVVDWTGFTHNTALFFVYLWKRFRILTYLYRRLFMSLRNKVNLKKKIKKGLGSLLVLTAVSTGAFAQANAVKADE